MTRVPGGPLSSWRWMLLGTPTQSARDADTLALLDYGFVNFHSVTPVVAGTVLARPTVQYRPGVHAPLIAASTFSRVLPRATPVRLQVQDHDSLPPGGDDPVDAVE